MKILSLVTLACISMASFSAQADFGGAQLQSVYQATYNLKQGDIEARVSACTLAMVTSSGLPMDGFFSGNLTSGSDGNYISSFRTVIQFTGAITTDGSGDLSLWSSFQLNRSSDSGKTVSDLEFGLGQLNFITDDTLSVPIVGIGQLIRQGYDDNGNLVDDNSILGGVTVQADPSQPAKIRLYNKVTQGPTKYYLDTAGLQKCLVDGITQLDVSP